MGKERQSFGASAGAWIAIAFVVALIVVFEDAGLADRVAGIFNSLAQLGHIGK